MAHKTLLSPCSLICTMGTTLLSGHRLRNKTKQPNKIMIMLKPNAGNIRSNLSNKREVHLASDKFAFQGHLFPGLLWQMPGSLRPQRVSAAWRNWEGRWGRGCVSWSPPETLPEQQGDTASAWTGSLCCQRPAALRALTPACLGRHYHSSCVFFPLVIYFSVRKECGEFTTGRWPLLLAAGRLFYKREAVETDG